MQDPIFEVNRDASLSLRQVGHERTPVLVFDDFAVDTAALRAHACAESDYGPDDSSRYPGVRAKLPRAYVLTVLGSLQNLLVQAYHVPARLRMRVVNAVYSLVTTRETALHPGQCHPHFDSTGTYYLAVLHYLNEGPFCDTGLFRHRDTGFETIDEERLATYGEARQARFDREGLPAQAYLRDSNDAFELYHRIEYRPNRLVVYPGRLLHSALVDPGRDIGADPRTGRLTANLFVDFLPRHAMAQGARA